MGGGLIAGKDGPLIHTGGIVGGGLGKLSPRSVAAAIGLQLPRGWAGPLHSDAGHRDCVLIGTAAGLAAAFTTPIGGLLLAIEQVTAACGQVTGLTRVETWSALCTMASIKMIAAACKGGTCP